MERGKDMRGTLMKKELIFGILFLLISASVAPTLSGHQTQDPAISHGLTAPTSSQTTTITIYIAEKTRLQKHTVTISLLDAETIAAQLQELRTEFTEHPNDVKTQQLKQQFIDLLYGKNIVPRGVTRQELDSLLQPLTPPSHSPKKDILPFQGTSSQWFCNFATAGEGAARPIIILPRFIPFILTPIPRAFVSWKTRDGITSVGGLRSQKGFIAYGNQNGIALGFWGIGFSIFLPPVNAYGIFGYAVYAKVTADQLEFWPPNNPPEITQSDPADGQQMVSISTTQLRFNIDDMDGDLMSFNVTTSPDIGSGSGGLKPSGTYAIPVSGVVGLTKYTWHIRVTDGKDTTEETLTFVTEPVGPVISNPVPANGEKDIPMDISSLGITLNDYQGKAMDYTIQTSPNIGSDHKVGVNNGTYALPVSGLTYGVLYRWFVNVTDGSHDLRKVFNFITGYPAHFDPFTYGWHYRKQVVIDHTKVTGDLTNFPVLISVTDPDLMKAQTSGHDILFMDGTSVATKLHHDLELFDDSTGTLTAWVNIPSLSSNQDTVFYLYYGNPDCADQSYSQKTWDASYLAVWHMNDATSSSIADSTFSDYSGAKTAANEPNQITGRVGTSQQFDGTNDAIQFSDSIIPMGTKTISGWVKKSVSDWQCLFSNAMATGSDNSGTTWNLEDTSGGTLYMTIGNGYDSHHYLAVWVPVPDMNWHYYTMVLDSSSHTLSGYRDGGPVVTSDMTSGSETPPTYNFRMGESYQPGYPYFFTGGMDEIRISNVIKSPQWISTEYMNQNNPAGFLSLGPEVPGP